MMSSHTLLPSAPSRPGSHAAVRSAVCLGVVGLLSACAGGQQISATQEASEYEARAHHSYVPPGSQSDPWGPYIHEASAKYDVPERWIREVMRVESGGRTEMNGMPITSGAGAMGLMQVMPATFDELRGRYDIGGDPYDPHNSILAGTAYIRELYDLYGNPGFLAAYNGGPGRLDDYLTRNRALPEETRRYVAKIGPYITDSFPTRKSTAEVYALNSLPTSIPAGPRYSSPADASFTPTRVAEPPPVEVAFAPPSATDTAYDAPRRTTPSDTRSAVAASPAPVAVAAADPLPAQFEAAPVPAHEPDLMPVTRPSVAYEPPPVRYTPAPAPMPRQVAQHAVPAAALPEPPPFAQPAPAVQTASAYGYAPQGQSARREQGFRFVSPAIAASAPPYRGAPGEWAIQVGAFGNEGLARMAVGAAREQAGTVLSSAHQAVAGVHEQHGTLYRARLTGLSRDAATQACERLRGRSNCIVLAPDAQS